MSPAMAAGTADRLRNVSDIVALIEKGGEPRSGEARAEQKACCNVGFRLIFDSRTVMIVTALKRVFGEYAARIFGDVSFAPEIGWRRSEQRVKGCFSQS
jgi:hypothetical protein